MANKVIESPRLLHLMHQNKRIDEDELDQVNRSLQDLKIDSPSARVISLNMGSRGGKGEGLTPDRRSTIELVVKTEYPDILFVQEVIAPSVSTWKLDIGDKFDKRNSEKEAGVLWNTDSFALREFVEVGAKNQVFESITRKGAPWADAADVMGQVLGRTCIVCLKHQKSSHYVMAVSWHGPWKATFKAKAQLFEALQDFCLAVRKRYFNALRPIPAIVIGGDFNLALEAEYRGVIAGELRSGFMFPTYEATERRSDRDTIDYFVHSKEVTIRDIAALEMLESGPSSSLTEHEAAKTSQRKLHAIDHDPVKAYLIFETPY